MSDAPGPPESLGALLELDPAQKVVSADRVQQRWMVCGHMISNHAHYLIVVLAAGHEPALASDQFQPATSKERNANR